MNETRPDNSRRVWHFEEIERPVPQVLEWDYHEFVKCCTVFKAISTPKVEEGLGILNPSPGVERIIVEASQTGQEVHRAATNPPSMERGEEGQGEKEMTATGRDVGGKKKAVIIINDLMSEAQKKRFREELERISSVESTSSLDEQLMEIREKTAREQVASQGILLSSTLSESALLLANKSITELEKISDAADLESIDTSLSSSNREMIDFDNVGSIGPLPASTSTMVAPGTPVSAGIRSKGRKRESSQVEETSFSTPSSSKQYHLYQLTPKSPRSPMEIMKRLEVTSSESEDITSQPHKSPSVGSVVTNYVRLVEEQERLKSLRSSRPSQGSKVQRVNIPGALPMKHAPSRGVPFKRKGQEKRKK